MCGRYKLTMPFRDIVALYNLTLDPDGQYKLRYNAAPSQDLPIVYNVDGQRTLDHMKWGLIPRWSKDGKPGPINARAETAATLATFRDAYQKRRCLVPADGFYEWMKTPDGKRPHLMTMRDGSPFSFAGLWEEWQGARTFTILTTTPNELLSPIHDRMPVIVPRERYKDWLAPSAPPGDIIAPYPAEGMNAVEVSSLVNSPKNDVPECIEPLNTSRQATSEK